MPVMQLSALMIHFWILPINLERPQEDKLPWNLATWCNATDVHSGLFPDGVSSLPWYIGWDMAQKNAVLRLFDSTLNKNAQAVWNLMAHPPADLKGAVKIWTTTWKKMWIMPADSWHQKCVVPIPSWWRRGSTRGGPRAPVVNRSFSGSPVLLDGTRGSKKDAASATRRERCASVTSQTGTGITQRDFGWHFSRD
ncbi:uncharacterized protein EI90DRAFT_3016897 [Cantharellus anzutake]|uniref:uncharacterized protein n=1 Tax=Cantharellus anzutake TaxID=1750568 RepID=UPI00190437E9|nr:uncharacterized protein EI90DRAFT_3016897 [Cantharellus anzutake]KAF8330168.1 hypothetical protein EI90DRAFT_3016897 [Cantharellus anzutake]